MGLEKVSGSDKTMNVSLLLLSKRVWIWFVYEVVGFCHRGQTIRKKFRLLLNSGTGSNESPALTRADVNWRQAQYGVPRLHTATDGKHFTHWWLVDDSATGQCLANFPEKGRESGKRGLFFFLSVSAYLVYTETNDTRSGHKFSWNLILWLLNNKTKQCRSIQFWDKSAFIAL